MTKQRLFDEILLERERQANKWGEQDHTSIEWVTILVEEVGEVAKAAWADRKYTDHNYREELIHVAAVCVAAIENLDGATGP